MRLLRAYVENANVRRASIDCRLKDIGLYAAQRADKLDGSDRRVQLHGNSMANLMEERKAAPEGRSMKRIVRRY